MGHCGRHRLLQLFHVPVIGYHQVGMGQPLPPCRLPGHSRPRIRFVHPPTHRPCQTHLVVGVDHHEPPRLAGQFAEKGQFHDGDVVHPERGLPYLFLNTNKRGVTLDLGTADGRALFWRLAATADAVVEGFAPGQMAAWGLDYEALAAAHPRLVMASITGFGQDGPYSAYLAPNLIAFAVGGLMYLSGDRARPPVTAPCSQAYLVGSVHAAVSVLTALWGRRTSGLGDEQLAALAEGEPERRQA